MRALQRVCTACVKNVALLHASRNHLSSLNSVLDSIGTEGPKSKKPLGVTKLTVPCGRHGSRDFYAADPNEVDEEDDDAENDDTFDFTKLALKLEVKQLENRIEEHQSAKNGVAVQAFVSDDDDECCIVS
jgi:hypothetical protein